MPRPEPIYTEANHTVYHGDMCAIVPWLDMVDHVWLDPPYSERTHTGARTNHQVFKNNKDHKLPFISFLSVETVDLFLRFSILSTRVKRWMFGTMDHRHIVYLEELLPADLEFVRKGVWIKPNGTPQFTGDRPSMGHEDIGIYHRKSIKKRWNGGGRTAVYIQNINGDGRYPSAKPERLVAEMVRDFTDPGDLILDPFCGSGTLATVCKKLGRRSISIDRSQRAVDLTITRLKATLEAPIIAPEPKRKQERITF